MRYRSLPSHVSGTVRAPPSKSYTHRALVLGALSGGTCTIQRPLRSEDTDATLAGIASFGASIEREGDDLRISGGRLQAPGKTVDARNSGTTLRLLSGVASLLDGTTTLTGDSSLRKRPMGPLLDSLNSLGARTSSLGGDGRPPVEVRGVLRGGIATLPGDVSSQFLSSLLLACPLAANPSEIRVLPPLRSEPYVGMTREAMARFGVELTAEDGVFRIAGTQQYVPTDLEVPGDFSSAAFPLVAAAIARGDVTVSGLDLSSAQGDRAIVELLRSFGASVDVEADRVRARGGDLAGQTVDVGETPDLFPVLAVLASQADGESRFVNGSHLRHKESDRIATTVSMLRALGVAAQATEDGCVVRGPNRLRGAFVDAQGDHRILMAAAVAGLVADDAVDISDPWCFRASYPSFLDDFRALGALHAVVG
ncbi:MAG TPA: 3-phosphoshikimate 1-carboxyvinyltransferase [Thermoplasmata archaeon]|nr:3-phosphoshikimate 1-carboxyvinyltransferase [Thermoplasmata archaeon]